MGKSIRSKSLKRTKRERIKGRLAKLEAVQKAKQNGTYIPKPWENKPLIQELYSFAIKTHKTGRRRRASTSARDDQTSISDANSLMDLGKIFCKYNAYMQIVRLNYLIFSILDFFSRNRSYLIRCCIYQ